MMVFWLDEANSRALPTKGHPAQGVVVNHDPEYNRRDEECVPLGPGGSLAPRMRRRLEITPAT